MLLVVGGQSRKIGKTAVAAGLIAAVPEAGWTAVKITQHVHPAELPANARTLERTGDFLMFEQAAPDETDTGRFLSAGARRAFWLQGTTGRLGLLLPALERILAHAGNTLIESNSILEFVAPDLCLMVLDPLLGDFKESCRRFLDRADAFILVAPPETRLSGIEAMLAGKPLFRATPPNYVPEEATTLVRSKLAARGKTTLNDKMPGDV
jgi:hypothetical protein